MELEPQNKMQESSISRTPPLGEVLNLCKGYKQYKCICFAICSEKMCFRQNRFFPVRKNAFSRSIKILYIFLLNNNKLFGRSDMVSNILMKYL